MLLLALLAQPALSADFTALDVARTRSVSQALVSPDGSRVATVVSEPRLPWTEGGEDGPARQHLYMVDPASGIQRPFLTGEASVSALSWTADGAQLAFLDTRGDDEHTSLYLLPADGGEAQRAHGHTTDIEGYALSPDRSRIAWLATPDVDAATKAARDKGFDAKVYEEQDRMAQLWVAPLGGTAEAPLALDGHVSDLSWAGDQLLVALASSPRVDQHYMDRTFVLVSPDDGSETARFSTPGKIDRVKASPDGQHVAFIAAETRDDPSPGRLQVFDRQGEKVDLLPNLEGHVDDITWLDEDTLYYVASIGCESQVGQVDLDGTNTVIVAPGTLNVRSLSASASGKQVALVADHPTHPSEAFFLSAGTEGVTRLTDSNPWLADIAMPKQEVIEWRARDGKTIQGVLVHPLGRAEGERVPLVVVVHGGPEAHEDNGWKTAYSRPGLLGAQAGWAVLYPNYRGSTGRGVAFSKLDQHDYAGREFDDIVDGVKHLVKQGLVDEDKVGITGGSYGGYASAWGATKLTKVYAASVMFVGISEQISKFGTTDIPNEMYWSHARAWPWDEWKFFDSRSPVRFTKDADTPLLILHGENDTRVHPTQSMMLYRYLDTLGKVPVRLVLYPGEGHGNRRAASRLDYTLRMMRWFTHYLEGGDRHAEPPPPELELPLPAPEE